MSKFRVTVKSYLSNNSDYAEYDVYYLDMESLDKAREFVNIALDHWTKINEEGIIYSLSDLEEVL